VALTPGARLGAYEIVSALGAGGMGEVYRARDTRLERDVAIKVLREAFATDPDRLRRFEHEARAIAALNHPHICQIHDIGLGYLVLEYVDGEPLHGPMAADHAVRLALQIASALEAAHRRGILHRDLKPANIMVTRDGAVKLLDFGLAKLIGLAEGGPEDLTRTLEGTVLGTTAYMSPEQAEGKALDARSDVFSFGAVLYEMLSGARAFAGNTTAQVLSAVLRDDPPPLHAPAALDGIVRRCLPKEPAQRFQTMADVRTALEQLSVEPADQQPSIAVLPFADMSAGKDHEWFSDGLSEEIINALTHVPGLKVTARTSAFAFRGKEQDITRIAEALRVSTILEGSVRRAGDRIRVTAQLINAEDGYHLWSERYDREMTDVFAIQDDIASAIATALQIKLSEKPGARWRHTPNLPAYEAYLKGRHYLYKMTAESLRRSRQYLEQAIDLDREFVAAHVGLGEYFFVIGNMSGQKEAVPQARASAQRALDLDPTAPEAHALLAMLASTYKFDWNEVEREFRFAMACEPITPFVRDHYGAFYLLQVGRVEEAGLQIERALQEDPLNLLFRVHFGVCLVAAGKDADAAAHFHQVLDIDPNYPLACCWLSVTYLLRGMVAEARHYAEHAFSLVSFPQLVGTLAGVARRGGDYRRAEPLVARLKDGDASGGSVGLALYHLMCLEIDEAHACLEQAVEQRDAMTMLAVQFRRFCASSPRWPAIAKTLNLPGAA
jgi:eukaryotic-like serine/threonine-protein kinase